MTDSDDEGDSDRSPDEVKTDTDASIVDTATSYTDSDRYQLFDTFEVHPCLN